MLAKLWKRRDIMKEKAKEKVVFDEYGNIAELDQKTKFVILKKEYDRATGEDEDEKFKWAKGTVKLKKDDDGAWECERGGNWEKIDSDIIANLNEWFLRDWFIEKIDDEDFAEDEVEFVLKTRPGKIIIKIKGEAEQDEEELGDLDEGGMVKWHKKINTERERGNHIYFKTKEGKEVRRFFTNL